MAQFINHKRLNKQDTIFVTGGTGLIGSYLLRLLIRNGYKQIRALKRAHSDMRLLKEVENQIEWLEGDLLDIDILEHGMQEAHTVFHCAAMVSFDPKEKEKMNLVNIEGTANMINVALSFNVEKFIHISSIAALGRRADLPTIHENTEWQSSDWNTSYAVSKYHSEMEVWRGSAEGLNVAIVNPSVVLGSAYWNKGTGRFFNIVWNGLKFYPTGSTGFVDVRDVAEAMLLLAESNISNERIILNGDNLPYKHIFDSIADLINKPRASIKVNTLIREASWRVDHLLNILFSKKPRVTKETARNSSRDVVYINDKSKELLGLKYRSIDSCLKQMAEQFNEVKSTGCEPRYLDF